MHSSQNVLGIKAFMEVVLRGFCKTYGTQCQIKTAAHGPTQRCMHPLPLGWQGCGQLKHIPMGQHLALEPRWKITIILFQGRSTFAL